MESVPTTTILESDWDTLCRLNAQSKLINFTRFFFVELYKRKFQVSKHHTMIADALDAVIRGETRKLIIAMPPRYGKTEIAVKNLISYCLCLSPSAKFIHLSYSDELALDNSEGIKAIVQSEGYQRLFPEVKIKNETSAKKKWYTTAGGGVYATSTGGQVTGFGAGKVELTDEEKDNFESELDDFFKELGHTELFGGLMQIDDAIKPDDSESEVKSKRICARWDSTIKSRVNSRKTPVVVSGQRTGENDFIAHLLRTEPGQWTVLSLPAIQTDPETGIESALWPAMHTLEELYEMRTTDPLYFGRQYMQNPVPLEGFLYWEGFKTYSVVPASSKAIRKSYVDTADTGKDFLCAIDYIETVEGMYIIDILYTNKAMETTEPLAARMFTKDRIQLAMIESNNGGRGWARNVDVQLIHLKNLGTKTKWFHQSGNKFSRITTNAARAQNLIYFPEGWEQRFPMFHKHIMFYQAAGGNAFDDAPDCISGMVEQFGKGFNVALEPE